MIPSPKSPSSSLRSQVPLKAPPPSPISLGSCLSDSDHFLPQEERLPLLGLVQHEQSYRENFRLLLESAFFFPLRVVTATVKGLRSQLGWLRLSVEKN